MRQFGWLVLFICFGFPSFAQTEGDAFQRFPPGTAEVGYMYRTADGGPVQEARIEPPNWWVGMENPNLQLLIYDEQIRDAVVTVDHPGVMLQAVHRVQNPNYLFLDIVIAPDAKPGTVAINLQKDDILISYPYELYQKPNRFGLYPGRRCQRPDLSHYA
jgi:hypothetical protein